MASDGLLREEELILIDWSREAAQTRSMLPRQRGEVVKKGY